MENTKEFKFSASHKLSKHPGKCRRLHGHNWLLEVTVSGEIDSGTGFVMDYAELSDKMEPLIAALDHRHLGEWSSEVTQEMLTQDGPRPDWEIIVPDEDYVPGLPIDFYPSSENLIMWIAERLNASYEPGPKWSKLVLHETDTTSCTLTREEYERTVRHG